MNDMKNVEHFGDLTKRMNTFREKVLDEKSSDYVTYTSDTPTITNDDIFDYGSGY